MESYISEDAALMREFFFLLPLMYRHAFLHPDDAGRNPIPINQMLALLFLSSFPDSNMTQLAGSLRISKQQLTKVVDVLVSKGLVQRKGSESNRRLVLLELTEEGNRLVEEIHCRQAEKSAQMFSGATEQERQALMVALRLLKRILDGYPGEESRYATARQPQTQKEKDLYAAQDATRAGN